MTKKVLCAAALLMGLAAACGPGPAGPAGPAGPKGEQGDAGLTAVDQSALHYRVAIDLSPLQSLPAGCWQNGDVPPSTTTSTMKRESLWSIWDVAGGKSFLDMGAANFQLGDADPVVVSGLIEGQNLAFSGSTLQRSKLDAGAAIDESAEQSIVVTFSDRTDTPTGSLALSSTYSSNPPVAGRPSSCSASLPFVAKRYYPVPVGP